MLLSAAPKASSSSPDSSPLQSESAFSDPIQTLKILCAKELESLETLIKRHLKNDVSLLEAVATHLICGGGKRIRPLLAIACYKALNQSDSKEILELAAAIEFIHNATLLHDDVIDDSYLRHGKPSAHLVFGSKASILVGDFLFAKAFELMLGKQEKRVLPILATVAQTITQGEVFQLGYLKTFDISLDVMMHIIGTKTAALFAASCEIGAALLGEDTTIQKAFHAYGKNLGITFQLTDDLLDYTGHATMLGKGIGDDLREGKVTLPLFFCYNNCDKKERKFLDGLLVAESLSDEDLNTVLTLLKRTKSPQKCMKLAEEYASEALKSLDCIPSSPFKDLLALLPKKLLSRLQ